MLGQAEQLGCSASDVVCLCNTANFRYGVRDCIAEACPASDQATVTSFGNSLCAAALASSGVATVTASGVSGVTTVIISTGTDTGADPSFSTLRRVRGMAADLN